MTPDIDLNLIQVVDVETTGFRSPPNSEMVEFAGVGVEIGEEFGAQFVAGSETSCLLDPGHPIPPEASAVHHLEDVDVRGKLHASTFRGNFTAGRPMLKAAHNAPFDRRYLDPERHHTWIDTLKIARTLWSDGKHDLQVMRYRLKLPVNRDIVAVPHRAASDAHVCAHLLIHALEHMTIEEMIELSKTKEERGL